MIRRFLGQSISDEFAHRQGICQPPGNPPFRINPLEVPQQQCPKVHTGSDTGSSQRPFVIAPAQMLYVAVEVMLVENLIQSLVKAMRGRIHDLTPDDPQILLPLPLLPGSHCHAV